MDYNLYLFVNTIAVLLFISNSDCMKTILSFSMFFCLFLFPSKHFSQGTNNTQLDSLISMVGDSIQGIEGMWQFQFKGRHLWVITDEDHNRMRIISPIALIEDLEKEHIMNAMTANFHTALDVKYAISEELMWAVFIHPLQELQHHQFVDAILQVFLAAENFGSTYASTELIFPGGEGRKESPPAQESPKKSRKI